MWKTRLLFLALLLALSLVTVPLSGCSSSDDDDDDDGDAPGDTAGVTALFSVNATSDGNGEAAARVEVPAGTNKMSITAQTPNALIATDSIVGDDGTVFVNFQGEELTLSTDFYPLVSAVNVPPRDFDPGINGGGFTHRVTTASSASGSSFNAAGGQPVTFTVLGRSDGDLRNGTLQLNVLFVGPAAGNGAVTDIVRRGLDEMRAIYSGAGISLNVSEFDIDGPSALPIPTDGSSLYANGSNGAPSPAVNIFVGMDLQGPGLLGVSGGIPGSPTPSPRSGVAVSFLAHGGADGAFSDAEVLVLGETLAHEAGHYLGLFHPVEGDFGDLDPLTDTPSCQGQQSCLSNDDLIHNMMFFTPVSDGQGGTVRQNRLTSQQRGVMNLYSAVD